MSNLLASLASAGNALDVYRQGLDVIQNNITNSTTPGYAKQSLNLVARPFDVADGLAGGVAARGLASARDEFAEEEVRRQVQSLGRFEAQAQGVASIENQFDVSGSTGVSADLNELFQSFSAWGVTPGSPAARQSVMASAGKLADDIRALAGSLATTSHGVENEIGTAVQQMNQLASTVQQYNVGRLRQDVPDPGLDAGVHSALEQLSQLADISTVTQVDGTITVLLNGGSPLVVGDSQFSLSSNLAVPDGAANPQAPPSSRILDWQGKDITGQIQSGKLGGLLDVHNRVLASLTGDGQQAGSVNRFASAFADTVNGVLQSGSTGPGGQPGSPLFVYDQSDATHAAGSFALNPNLTPNDLAPVDSGGNANGNAIQLASLANSPSAGIDRVSFGTFFSQIAAAIGRESASAKDNQQTQQQVVAQTRALRDQSSGVSLDEQAVLLIQFQRNYQAAAKLLTTLNDIANTTINLIP